MSVSIFGQTQDIFFMQEALLLAQEAAGQGEVPIGALVVNQDGIVIGRGYNCVEATQSQQNHAEMCAIAQATQAVGSWRLDNCWLYVTLEPCMMCIGLIRLSRIKGLVYGAKSPQFGFCAPEILAVPMYKEISLLVVSGVMEQEAKAVLQIFFKERRRANGE